MTSGCSTLEVAGPACAWQLGTFKSPGAAVFLFQRPGCLCVPKERHVKPIDFFHRFFLCALYIICTYIYRYRQFLFVTNWLLAPPGAGVVPWSAGPLRWFLVKNPGVNCWPVVAYFLARRFQTHRFPGSKTDNDTKHSCSRWSGFDCSIVSHRAHGTIKRRTFPWWSSHLGVCRFAFVWCPSFWMRRFDTLTSCCVGWPGPKAR